MCVRTDHRPTDPFPTLARPRLHPHSIAPDPPRSSPNLVGILNPARVTPLPLLASVTAGPFQRRHRRNPTQPLAETPNGCLHSPSPHPSIHSPHRVSRRPRFRSQSRHIPKHTRYQATLTRRTQPAQITVSELPGSLSRPNLTGPARFPQHCFRADLLRNTSQPHASRHGVYEATPIFPVLETKRIDWTPNGTWSIKLLLNLDLFSLDDIPTRFAICQAHSSSLSSLLFLPSTLPRTSNFRTSSCDRYHPTTNAEADVERIIASPRTSHDLRRE